MNWTKYYMGFTKLAAQKSKDSTKVGAILVGPDGEIRLTAYNGVPRGVEDTPARLERPAKYLFAAHAEQNLVAFAAREGIHTKGCTAYVTHHPCAACARILIQAGITAVYIGGDVTADDRWKDDFAAAFDMFREAGVSFQKANPRYSDNWADIAGYAKLVADRLEREERGDA